MSESGGRREGGPPIDASASRPSRSRRTSRDERHVVVLLACVGATVATFGGAAPTGIRLVDLGYVGLAGAALVFAGGRSRRMSWLISGLGALWLTPTTAGRLAAVAALIIALYAVQRGRRRALGAAVGAILAFVLGDLGGGSFLGASTLFALLAATPMLVSGARLIPDQRRRNVVLGTSLWAAGAALASLLFVFSAALAIGDVGSGVDAANRGFDFASAGDDTSAGNSFDSAAVAFDRARGKVSGFWTLPARLVPVVGQHVRAVQVVTAEGVALTESAGDTARAIDPDDLRLVDGALDLTLVQDLEPVLDRVERALTRARDRVADARTPWLLPPVEDRMDELVDELNGAAPAAHTAALAAREVPGMLGADEPVHWLVAMTTPAEARGLGGLLGNWAVVEADGGKISVVASGRNEDVNARLRSRGVELAGPEQYLARWAGFTPEIFFQDVTLSPDLAMVSEVTAGLFEKAMDIDVDGILFADPYAVAAVLELSGPLVIDGQRLTSSTVVPYLLEGQYIEYEGDEPGRVFVLDELVEQAFASLTSITLPGPRAVADVFGAVVDQDRLGLWWQELGGPDELIQDAGLDGRFPPAAGGDLLALVHQNAGQNKLDNHLRREVDYRLRTDNGAAEAVITVTLHNDLNDLTLPDSIIASNDQGYPIGTNVARLAVHSPLGLQAATLDGEPFLVGSESAFGNRAFTALIEVPAGEFRVLELSLRGPLALTADDYRLTLAHQPLVQPDQIRLDVVIDGTAVVLPSDALILTADTVVGPGAS